jgi:undecaprenyl pyrophosphate synthase
VANSYAELYFDVLWPDFTEQNLYKRLLVVSKENADLENKNKLNNF